jgi:hypothetical protein
MQQMSYNILITRTFSLRAHNKFKMDMLSRCRKQVPKSPETKRRSPRIAQHSQPSTAKRTVRTDINDKCFANIDSSLPAISQRQNGNIILRMLAKPGAKQSGITGDTYNNIIIYYFGF